IVYYYPLKSPCAVQIFQELVDNKNYCGSRGVTPLAGPGQSPGTLPLLLTFKIADARFSRRRPQHRRRRYFWLRLRRAVIDDGCFPEDALRGLHSLTAIFFRIGHPDSPASILGASRDLVEWFASHPEGPAVKQLFRELLVAGLQRLKGPHPLPSIPEELEEVVHMLATHVEKWSRDIKQQGWQEGRQEGEAKILTRQLQRRFGDLPPWASQKIADAGLATLEEWSLRILDATTIESVLADPGGALR
ncbi:MAG: DUF4351 domain-containing protein, partial [Magnetococcales bacterium]|nr:DUF4351 domain-containing protein [Magnetococcales bacterium]